MELEQLFIADIYKLTNKDELINKYEATKVKETILYRKGYIDTKYIDLKTGKVYTGDYNKINIGEDFVNENTLKSYSKILEENEQEEEQTVRNVLVRYKKYKNKSKN